MHLHPRCNKKTKETWPNIHPTRSSNLRVTKANMWIPLRWVKTTEQNTKAHTTHLKTTMCWGSTQRATTRDCGTKGSGNRPSKRAPPPNGAITKPPSTIFLPQKVVSGSWPALLTPNKRQGHNDRHDGTNTSACMSSGTAHNITDTALKKLEKAAAVRNSVLEAFFLGPPAPRVSQWKNFGSRRVEFEVLMCGGICVKFPAAFFPGKRRATICEKFRQNFAAFFAGLFRLTDQKFHPNFALGNYRHNFLAHFDAAGKFFQQLYMLSLPRFGHISWQMAAGKSGEGPEFLLRDRHSLL